MTEPVQYALRDNAIYNPHLLGKKELIALFSARENLLAELLEDLRRCQSGETAQHHLIVAHRGMGKTMLLRRLQFAIEDDPALSNAWLPLAFPEEQYNVGRLSDFWLNCLDALGDSLERHGRTAQAEQLDAAHESLLDLPEEERSRKTLALLIDTSEQFRQRFVLLIDNIDLVLGRIGDQAWALREALSEEPSLLLVGASSRALEATYKYDQPFYDFFHVHELRGLTVDETTRLLSRYAEQWQNDEVLRVIRDEPERIRTLHALTGGNPRTLALLYNILGRGLDGDVRTDLESLLDQCTPLYKARLEALPAQQQRIVHALAVHWHPTTAATVARELRIEVNAVSSQLSRLVKEGTVEAVTFDPETKTGYQLAERFFNIWYLMRATRRARRRLIWFVEFLKMFYSQDELLTHARQHLISKHLEPLPSQERLRYAEYSFALAQALPDLPLRRALETSGLFALLGDTALRAELDELVDLDGEEAALRPRAEHMQRLDQLKATVHSARPPASGWDAARFWEALAHSVNLLEVKEDLVTRLPEWTDQELVQVEEDFARQSHFFAEILGSEAAARNLQRAFAEGWMMTTHDAEGGKIASLRLAEPRLEIFALARKLRTIDDPKPLLDELSAKVAEMDTPALIAMWARGASRVEEMTREARETLESIEPEKVASPHTVLDIAVALLRADQPGRAAEWIDRAAEFGHSGTPASWIMDLVLAWTDVEAELRRLHRVEQAEAALRIRRSLAEIAASLPQAGRRELLTWGYELLASSRFADAVAVFREATTIAPRDAATWASLAHALQYLNQRAEAEEAYRHAIDLDPASSFAWLGLGQVVGSLGRHQEAEVALRKATEVDPENAIAWLDLATALANQGRFTEAEDVLRRALEIDRKNVQIWLKLGAVLAANERTAEAEETFRKAIELDPELGQAWLGLGSVIGNSGRYPEAEEALRKATELDPENAIAWRDLATVLSSQGLVSEAEGALRRCIEIEPESLTPWAELGALLLAQSRLAEAIEAYRKALEIDPGAGSMWYSLGVAVGRLGRHQEAEEAFRKATELEPENVGAWQDLATALFHQERLEDAEQALRRAEEIEPENERTWQRLGDVLIAQGRAAEADEAYRKAVGIVPEAGSAWYRLGSTVGSAGRHEEAEAAFRKATELEPENPNAWLNLSGALWNQKRLGEAEEMLREGVKIAPENVTLRVRLGTLLFQQNRPTEAEEAFREAIEIDPKAAAAWRQLGVMMESLERHPEAEVAFRKATELEPENARTWHNLGAALINQGRIVDAEEPTRRALAIEPRNAGSWLQLGSLLGAQERWQEATEALHRATDLEPNSMEGWLLLGRVLDQHQLPDDAEKALRKAMELSPNDSSISNDLAWLLFDRDRSLEEAEALARSAIDANPGEPAYAHTLACILAGLDQWPEAFERAETFITGGDDDFHEAAWGDILSFFRLAVAAGKAREAADLLDRSGLSERWLPLREALETLARGRREYLRRLAPEVREPVLEILGQLEDDLRDDPNEDQGSK